MRRVGNCIQCGKQHPLEELKPAGLGRMCPECRPMWLAKMKAAIGEEATKPFASEAIAPPVPQQPQAELDDDEIEVMNALRQGRMPNAAPGLRGEGRPTGGAPPLRQRRPSGDEFGDL